MTALERLHDIVYESGINIVDSHFSATKKAACLCDRDCKLIIMDMEQIPTIAEETAILSEEVGHHKTGSLSMINATFNMPIRRINQIKGEGMAKRWAIKYVLPFDDLREAISCGYRETEELAEYLNLPQWFVENAVHYYVEICGLDFNDVQALEGE